LQEKVLLGSGADIIEIPRAKWEEHVTGAPDHAQERLGFMLNEHHLVRDFVVRELPQTGSPLAPGIISQALELPLARVDDLLNQLQEKLFFLVRDKEGAVSWAYPVTSDQTPHRLNFSSGEQLYAA
jgi:hypothetical protein